jgi:RNA-binding protein
MGKVFPRPAVADLSSHDMAALRATGQALDVAFAVGKDGVTDGVVKELQNRLSREPLVKVRILKGAREGEEEASTKDLARDLAARARVTLVEVRGHTALFHRPPRHKRGPEDF